MGAGHDPRGDGDSDKKGDGQAKESEVHGVARGGMAV